MDQLTKLWHSLHAGPEIEVGVAIPIGCLVPIAAMLAVVLAAGVMVGSHLATSSAPTSVVVRVIDDGAKGGPAVLSTSVVPLR